MATVAPPVRTAISNTYPNPDNATARTGFGALWDYATNLLGTVGSPATARTALGVAIGTDVQAYSAELTRLQTTATVAFGATPTFDAAAAYDHLFGALTANVTAVILSNPVQSREICIRVKQDGTGGRTWTHPTAPAAAKGAGTIGTLAGQVSLIYYKYNLADTRWEYAITVLAT